MQKNQVWFIIGLVFAIIVTIFALTNSNTVAVSLFFYKFEASLAIVIFVSVAVGAVITVLLGIARHVKIRGELKKLKNENEALIQKNKELSASASQIIPQSSSAGAAGQELPAEEEKKELPKEPIS